MANNSAQDDVILLEFNELVPDLLERFMAQGELPNFSRFYRESRIMTTDAKETGEKLNPWVQWVTVHSGLTADEHGIEDLTEGSNLDAPRIWDVVSQQGEPVWVCGSMNASYQTPLKGAFLPDPWALRATATPAELTPFYEFVSHSVQEHTADNKPITKGQLAQAVKFLVSHGLSLHTAKATVEQLTKEKFNGGRYRWKRIGVLNDMQWDIFQWYYRTLKPRLSTMFLNTVAHLQHHYWRHMEPELFSVKPQDDDPELANAILWGYKRVDYVLGQAMALAGPNTTIALAGGLSQQPFLKYEAGGGKRAYRVRDHEAFLAAIGAATDCEFHPVMTEQFSLLFKNEQAAEDAQQRMQQLTCNGQPAIEVSRDGVKLFITCIIRTEVNEQTTLDYNGQALNFLEHFYQVGELKAASHNPNGILWFRMPDRQHWVKEEKVCLTQIAPTLLGLLGLPVPATMKAQPLDLSSIERSDMAAA